MGVLTLAQINCCFRDGRTEGQTTKSVFRKKLDTPQKNELCQMLGIKRERQNKLFIENKKRQIDFEAKHL